MLVKNLIACFFGVICFNSLSSQTVRDTTGNHCISVFTNGVLYKTFDGDLYTSPGFGCKFTRFLSNTFLIDLGYRNAFINEIINEKKHEFLANWFSVELGGRINHGKASYSLQGGPSIGKHIGLDCSTKLNYFFRNNFGGYLSVATTFYRENQYAQLVGQYVYPLSTRCLLQLQIGFCVKI